MSKSFDHDRVSGSLSAFLDGTLARDDALLVEQHLATCESCRREVEVVELLRAPVDDALTASERLSLEHHVMAGIADDSPSEVSEFRSRRRVGARVAQVLGAAAAVGVLGTLLYFGSTMGGSDDEAVSGGADTAFERADNEGLEDSSGRDKKKERPQPIAAADQGNTAEAGSGSSSSSVAAAPRPRFTVAGDPYTSADLQKLGESSLASVTFANYYSADDAGGRNTLLEQLVAAAEAASGRTISTQVDECGRQVLDTADPTIPTFGALGELDGQPALILGFAWSQDASGPLDRYMVWAWAEGSCGEALDFVDGRIETAG